MGAFKPRMIRLVGRKADGWLPSLGVLSRDELRAGNEQIDAAAEKAGRDPGSIRRIINVQGVIGEQPAPPRSERPARSSCSPATLYRTSAGPADPADRSAAHLARAFNRAAAS